MDQEIVRGIINGLPFSWLQINPTQFVHTIETINAIMQRAEKISLNIFDNVMECLTIYTWPMLFPTHYQRVSPISISSILLMLIIF